MHQPRIDTVGADIIRPRAAGCRPYDHAPTTSSLPLEGKGDRRTAVDEVVAER